MCVVIPQNYVLLNEHFVCETAKVKMPGETTSKIKKHCVLCGKPETKSRNIDAQYICDECRKNVPSIQEFNIEDTSNLAEINFGTFKSWLTGTLQLAFQEQFKKYVENLQAENQAVKNDLATVKQDLKAEKNKVAEQKKTITDLQTEVNELRQTVKDTTKYLVNVDRNSRQHNAVIFGVSENDLQLKRTNDAEAVVARNDSEKVYEILKIVGFEDEVKQHIRLGKKGNGDRPRPIKLIFHSPAEAASVISNSSKLKDVVDEIIFIKPDKTKKENDEFKRVGDKKRELLEQYPTMPGTDPRVVLKKGVLTLDGAEVTRYQPVQTLF